jgi:putative transposase
MTKRDFYPILKAGEYYHIINKGNNGDNLFYHPKNYYYFLQKYAELLCEYVETCCYCLLPNHFHLLVRVRSDNYHINIRDDGQVVSNQFRKFFLGYAQAINKQEGRTGSLFQKNFKRLLVDNDDYRRYLVLYIHFNPRKHGIDLDFKSYSYSSYQSLLCNRPTKLKRDEVIAWFGSDKKFVAAHDVQSSDVDNVEFEEDEL